MYRIDNASSVSAKPVAPAAGTPGYFSNGNPATAQEATIVDDWWANQIQEEILTVIEQAGIVPDKSSNSQLFDALNFLYQGQGSLDDTYLTIAAYRQFERPVLTSGAPAAYTVTYPISIGALIDGMTHLVEFHVANGAQAAINFNALGNKPIMYYSVGAWRQIPQGLVGPNQQRRLSYHLGTDAYRLTGWEDRTGDFIPTGRSAARLGTILASGQAIDRVQYAGLFAAFGITYGQGNGSTTFNLPDLRGRMVAGTDQGAGRLTATMSGALGSFGGVETQTYNVSGTAPSQSVSVTGTINGSAATNGMQTRTTGTTGPADSNTQGQGGGGFTAATQYHGHAVDLYGTIAGNAGVTGTCTGTGWTGGGTISGTTDTRSNMPPTLVANYAIVL
jgi:microcystin-dependent protein